MKNAVTVCVLILLVGCSDAAHITKQESSNTPQASLSQQAASRPTVILSAAHGPVGQCETVYADGDYVFVVKNYGPKGKQTPGLFVFSQKMKKWMEINKLSTEGAKFGRSPTPEEGLCSVRWDYSGLQKADYATIPLMTSGSLNFPDKILYDADTVTYLLQFNSSWNIDAVLTRFSVKKDDLNKAFGEQGADVPQQGAEPDGKSPAAG